MSITSIDIDPGLFSPPFLEDETTVRARLLAAVPDGMATESGTWVGDWVEINVAEDVRGYAALNWIVAQMFPAWATGQQLDAHALSYGLTRGAGLYATGIVRVSGTAGLAVPPATIFEVPATDPNATRIRYQSTNSASLIVPTSGYVDVPVIAFDVGTDFNQPAGAVSLLETVLGNPNSSPPLIVSSVNNLLPMSGGEDPQDDYDLRQDVLAQARLPVGSGTPVDYLVWGKSVPGVGAVAVYGQWDTAGIPPGTYDGRQNGSVLLSLLDSTNAPVGWSIVYAAQVAIDPSRMMLGMLEEYEGWVQGSGGSIAPIAWDTTNVQFGLNALKLPFSGAGAASAVLTRGLDMSRFGSADGVFLWVYSSNWAEVNLAASTVEFLTDSGDYYAAAMNVVSPHGTAAPTTGSGWWLWRVDVGQFTATGTPEWSQITEEQITITALGAVNVTVDYLVARYNQGNTGVGGLSPIGADVTCVSPVVLPITIEITNSFLEDGYTLTGAPGTTNVKTLLQQNLTDFLQNLAPGSSVRFYDVAMVIKQTAGIIDFTLTMPQATSTPAAVPVAVNEYAQLNTSTFSVA